MPYKKLQMISFLVILAVVFGIVFFLFKPFLNVLAFAVIVAILFSPIHRRIKAKIKSPSAAAGLTVFLVLLILVIPAALFGQILFNELLKVYQDFRAGGFVIDQGKIMSSLPSQVQTFINSFANDLNSFISKFTASAFSAFTSVISNVSGFFLALFLFFFSLFYLLKDGSKIKEVIMDISPINNKQEHILIQRISEAVNGVVKGSFLVALAQGTVAFIGFIIFGVPQPFLWALFTVLAALVPNIGTSISLIPAVIYLFITDHIGAGIGMAIWGSFAVGLIDNVLSPKLIASKTRLHPLLVIFSVIGGIQLFGFLGFLIGPILMAIFVVLIEMYRSDFKEYLEQ